MDGYEPHDHITLAVVQGPLPPVLAVAGEVYPGYGDRVGGRGGYTGTQPSTSPRTHISLFLRLGPYPRPNEGKSRDIDEVS